MAKKAVKQVKSISMNKRSWNVVDMKTMAKGKGDLDIPAEKAAWLKATFREFDKAQKYLAKMVKKVK